MNNFRIEIDFNGKTKKIFSFLEQKYGFRLFEEKLTFVQYKSNEVFINIYHGRRSCEIGVEVGLLNANKSEASLPTMMEALVPDHKDQFVFQATEPEVVNTCLFKIAGLLQQFCESLLLGDKVAWKKIAIQHIINEEKFFKKYSIAPIKEKAYEAWQEKRYVDVVKLYNSAKHYLTNLEKKRLEYAERKIK